LPRHPLKPQRTPIPPSIPLLLLLMPHSRIPGRLFSHLPIPPLSLPCPPAPSPLPPRLLHTFTLRWPPPALRRHPPAKIISAGAKREPPTYTRLESTRGRFSNPM